MKKYLIIIFTLLVVISCKEDKSTTKTNKETSKSLLVKAPTFSGENAFNLVAKQVAFGPRVPNSEGHIAMGFWLVDTLKKYADTVYVQEVDLKAFDGTILKSKNIIASFNTTIENRIFIAAHWDTRPFADQDSERQNEPILGANDGASGVAVLIELARIVNENKMKKGLDLIFFDSEDYGQPNNSKLPYVEDSYCLGSQYWSVNPHVQNYRAKFGILLDMVGAKDAIFTQEGYSRQYANTYLQKVWNYGKLLGYGKHFSFNKTNKITDDHFYVNTIANIPTLDILHHDKTTPSGFGKYWHTHNDNLDAVDKETLKAVGQTVTQVIYQYDAGKF